ncbi:MAG: hypothetical protein RI897_160 [Verrucomicrobiota bacterium]
MEVLALNDVGVTDSVGEECNEGAATALGAVGIDGGEAFGSALGLDREFVEVVFFDDERLIIGQGVWCHTGFPGGVAVEHHHIAVKEEA